MSAADDSPKASGEERDTLAELNDLLDRTNKQVTELKQRQAELDAMVQLPALGCVAATFDHRGLLLSLEIDDTARKKLDSAGLMQDLNIALARAERKPAELPENPGDPEATAGLIESIFSGLTSGLSAEPVTFTNDLETVTVTTMWGEVLRVDCTESWISASPSPAISAEIVRVVNHAARADDPLNRRKDPS